MFISSLLIQYKKLVIRIYKAIERVSERDEGKIWSIEDAVRCHYCY